MPPPTHDQLPKIREWAREGLRSGELPKVVPDRTWGGFGSGRPCGLCHQIIGGSEVEIEFEAPSPQSSLTNVTYRMHRSCYTAWEREALDGSGDRLYSDASDPTVDTDSHVEGRARR